MKKIFIALSVVAILAFLAWHCSEDDYPTVVDNEASRLEGTWFEEFTWRATNIIIFNGGRLEDTTMTKRTTINLQEGNFEIKILPPNRILTPRGDSIITTVSSDTLYSGTYSASGDTLTFFMGQQKNPELFRYRIESDSLFIRLLPIADSSGLGWYASGSFLWGNTFSKTSGKFLHSK